MGYLFAGGFTAPSGSSSICKTEMGKGLFPNAPPLAQESLPSHGSASVGYLTALGGPTECWGGGGKRAADFSGRQVIQSQHMTETLQGDNRRPRSRQKVLMISWAL